MTKMKITKNTLVSQKTGNIVSDMDGEKVMLSIQSGKYFNLGEIGGEIWELIKEPTSIHNLVTTIQSQYDVAQDECEQQVTAFLNQLVEEELIMVEGNDK
ncbi:PqqD family protein [Priestia megaterium]|uniref:lasso peptide biosynthesis PqqD family chaperone n=1 Tax=Priestia megaterium TaxID=1404 RepID=UPI000BFB1490|nr:lasso peptide biosynthesis PqqD family chaperone [Priestia megaterium]PGK22489.1 PqqD family protein [Priestia megaterium]